MSDYSYEEQKAIGEKVKERISALGFTRAQVAEQSKISLASLRMIINGQKYPTGPQIKRLCETLKITPNYLLFGSERPDFEGDAIESLLWSLRISFTMAKLDKDSAEMIERLALSMAASQMKKSEYEKMVDNLDAILNKARSFLKEREGSLNDLDSGVDMERLQEVMSSLLGEALGEITKAR